MQKKVLFGFDYTDNEFVKIILYLFVGGSAALIEWAFFYVFSEAAGICAISLFLQAGCAMAKRRN